VHPAWWWGAAAALLLLAVRTVNTPRTIIAPEAPHMAAGAAATESAETESAAATRATSELRGSITAVRGGDAVRFDLTLPTAARQVAIVGDFNGWDASATPMQAKRAVSGGKATWSAQVELAPGRHVYAFVVDGARWLVDPLAPQVQDAGFGPSNALIVDGGLQ
jgi:1,4-alpha-glucan branching enzyme